MSSIMLMIGMMLVGLMLIALFVKWYTQFCYRLLVVNKDDVLDALLATGDVPAMWRKRSLERFARSAPNRIRRIIERHLIAAYARRIDGLISYVRAHRRMTADEKREAVVALLEVKFSWQSSATLGELISPNS